MKQSLKHSPENFFTALILFIGFSLLAALIINQVYEYNNLIKLIYENLQSKAKVDSEYIKISLENLIKISLGNDEHLDTYIEALNNEKFFSARIIHSASINNQFLFESDEQPEHSLEIKALKTGKSYNWETDDYFVNAFPILAEKVCQECHFYTQKMVKPVPLTYPLALVEIKLSKKQFLSAKKHLQRHVFSSIAIDALIAVIFIYLVLFASIFLRKISKRNRLILEKALNGFVMMNSKGIILSCNNSFCEMLGYSIQELEGTDIRKLCGKMLPDHSVEDLSSENIKDLLIPANYYKTKEGKILDVETTVSYIKPAKEKFYYSFIRDITEAKKSRDDLKKAKEKAEAATKIKNKFIGLVAHDLKSPLGSMLGLLNLTLNNKYSLHAQQKEYLERVMTTTQNMLVQSEKLLKLSSLESGEITLNTCMVDLRLITVSVIEGISYLAEKKGIDLKSYVPAGIQIVVDPNLFFEVVQNLVSNAIKFCKSGDNVLLFIPDDGLSALAVSDTGVGIDEARFDTLFSYEETTSTYGTAGEKGTGLGLPYCKDILDAHGGSIRVQSTVGKGSTFFIAIPQI